MSDDLHELFEGLEQPPVNDLAKQRAKRAAMAAFKEQKQKQSNSPQGNEQPARPTDTSKDQRKEDMPVLTKKAWFGGLAACCVLGIGLATFKPDSSFKAPMPDLVVDEDAMASQEGRLSKSDELDDLASSDSAEIAMELGEAEKAPPKPAVSLQRSLADKSAGAPASALVEKKEFCKYRFKRFQCC